MNAFRHFSFSLDQKQRDLIQEKEELLKGSKVKSTTLDSVKTQIELLVKVGLSFFRSLQSTNDKLPQAASEIQKKVDDIVQPISSQLTNDS